MQIIISSTGHQHRVDWKKGRAYYRCNHAVGSFPAKKVIYGETTCKNCNRSLR